MTQVDTVRRFDVSGETVWRVVADPARLAEWVPTARSAEAVEGQTVHLVGESHGHPYAVTGPLHANPSLRRLDWSAPGIPGYAGSLQVVDGDACCDVQLRVTVPDDRFPILEAAVAEVRRGAEEALDLLASLVCS